MNVGDGRGLGGEGGASGAAEASATGGVRGGEVDGAVTKDVVDSKACSRIDSSTIVEFEVAGRG